MEPISQDTIDLNMELIGYEDIIADPSLSEAYLKRLHAQLASEPPYDEKVALLRDIGKIKYAGLVSQCDVGIEWQQILEQANAITRHMSQLSNSNSIVTEYSNLDTLDEIALNLSVSALRDVERVRIARDYFPQEQ